MRPFIVLLACSAFAAADPAWRWKPGASYTWECRAQSTFIQQRTFKDRITRTVASPDTCTLTIAATVTAVGDDGSARLEFEVRRVVLAAVWHDTGAKGNWDSKTDKEVVPGFQRYAAIAGHKWTALVGGDGEIREMRGSAWPKICDIPPPERASKGEQNAASTMRDPDPARTWLDLIFAGAPREEKSWTVSFNLPKTTTLAAAPDGRARAVGADCAVVRIESPREGPDAVPQARRFHGRAWFDTQAGCLAKAEMEGVEDAKNFRPGFDQSIRWTVELTSHAAPPAK